MNGTDKISPDDVLDGYSARDIFEGGQGCAGFTYDDLIVLPGTFATARIFGVGVSCVHEKPSRAGI